jgi:hypothetical protein
MAVSKSLRESLKPPILRVTRYDLVSSFMIAVVAALVVSVIWLTVVWYSNRISKPAVPPVLELIEIPGGVDDGSIDETLRIDSPDDPLDDPSLEDAPEVETEIEEMIEHVVELSPEAAQQVQQQFELDVESSGKSGSVEGTGRRALGRGAGQQGMPRDQRWFVRFSDHGGLEEYARQLQFFGIELGALLEGNRLVYLARLGSPQPVTRTVSSGGGEKRLYMTWQGGNLRRLDVQLFHKAGIDVGVGTVFHFYPPETEAMLAKSEREYRNVPVKQIRRTYFVVRRSGATYKFVVTRQTFFR